jgi:predicted Ser/Thr protein kinase
MRGEPNAPSEEALVRWIEDSLATGSHRLGAGYQAQTLLYADASGPRYVIKVPHGRGPRRWLSLLMLRHEARVYARIEGAAGIPRCYGLLRNRYLVLEYVAGEMARNHRFADRDAFFAELLACIEALHARGVAHSDLQKKDNLLVVGGRHPCLIDFGAAVIRKPGFAPFNHFHYRFAAQLDFNQWAKLKYRGRLEDLSAADRRYYHRTSLERWARALKRVWQGLRRCVPRNK